MKIRIRVITAIFFIIPFYGHIIAQEITFEKRDSFFPRFEEEIQQKVISGYLQVPENWESKNGKRIKVAVTILKNTSNLNNADPVVYIQGGPGASGIQNIRFWLYHPLRKKNDIVLFDVRGTGFSEPRLCPNLGRKFFEILAKDQEVQEDETQKIAAAVDCKKELVKKGINIDVYNSLSVSRDLHALKTILGYKNWNVFGVSYGTYMAQVYANTYPNDIKSLLLDSPIYDISTYYVENTENYIESLEKLFEACKNEEACKKYYPNLNKVFYEVIAELKENPLTVSVEKNLISSGKFTYNSEDFKIAVQQALYHRELIELVPLLIYQFKDRNKDALGNLVAAFSSLLNMDYGVYYCVSCTEALPYNDFLKYKKNASAYDNLNGGISFYKSDFKVCKAWTDTKIDSVQKLYNLSDLSRTTFPVLVFSGGFDPITPLSNGAKVARRFNVAYNIEAHNYGHAPGSTIIGSELAENFVNNPNQEPSTEIFENSAKLKFASGIIINSGISKLGNSLNTPDPIFLFPVVIAIIIMSVFILTFFIKLIKNKYSGIHNKIVRLLLIITSIVGVLFIIDLIIALLQVSRQNFFILAFGLPESSNNFFLLRFVFLGCLILTLLYYILTIKKTQDRIIIFSVLFSNILLSVYLLYWGIF